MKTVILGAGMSGLAFAIYAKKKKLNPVLITKESNSINYGETVHPGFGCVFKLLDIPFDIEDHFFQVNGVKVYSNSNNIEQLDYHKANNWLGYQLERPKFDEILLKEAHSLGIRIIRMKRLDKLNFCSSGFISSIEIDSKVIKGSIFIDATGRNMILAKRYGIKDSKLSKKLICTYGKFPHKYLDKKNYSLFKWKSNGWLWESQINSNYRSWVFLKINERNLVSDNLYKNSINGYRNCTWKYSLESFKKNLFLIGDASFSFDPSSSNGILKAFMSSIYLINLITQFDIHKAGEIYSKWILEWIKKDYKHLIANYNNNGMDVKLSLTHDDDGIPFGIRNVS